MPNMFSPCETMVTKHGNANEAKKQLFFDDPILPGSSYNELDNLCRRVYHCLSFPFQIEQFLAQFRQVLMGGADGQIAPKNRLDRGHLREHV